MERIMETNRTSCLNSYKLQCKRKKRLKLYIILKILSPPEILLDYRNVKM